MELIEKMKVANNPSLLKAVLLGRIVPRLNNLQGELESYLLQDKRSRNLEDESKEFVSISQVEEEILSVLYPNKEDYGLGIISTIEKVSGGKKKLAANTLYPTLRRMESADKGYISSRWGDEKPEELVERSGARRRYYKLTDKGREALEELWQYRENLLGVDKLLANNL